jgi:hypothetical protein
LFEPNTGVLLALPERCSVAPAWKYYCREALVLPRY